MDLTAHNDSSEDADRQAGAEIEVTEEMVEAGSSLPDLIGFEWGWDDSGILVSRVYRAMEAARRRGRRHQENI